MLTQECVDVNTVNFTKSVTAFYMISYCRTLTIVMKMSRFQRLKTQSQWNAIRYYKHHDPDVDEFEGDTGFFVIMISIIIGIWWGVVHLIDIFFNALAWWQEPLTIFPVLFILIPYLGLTDRYGRNPLHWWPIMFGTTVEIPTVMSDPFNDELEEVLEDLGPMKVYMVDHETLKFRRKQDATMFCLQNL